MARLLSNRNVEDATFDTAQFDGEWLASFGRPELRGSWIIYGGSGSGKSTFALMLAKYLSRWRRVMYDSLEQGLSRSMQMAWRRVGMREAGSNVVFSPGEQLDEVVARLERAKSPGVVIIDSITAMSDFDRRAYDSLVRRFRDKLFVFVAHERNHRPDPAIAEYVRRLSEVKVHVEGFRAYVTTRYTGADGTGGADFVIWTEGSDEYYNKLQ